MDLWLGRILMIIGFIVTCIGGSAVLTGTGHTKATSFEILFSFPSKPPSKIYKSAKKSKKDKVLTLRGIILFIFGWILLLSGIALVNKSLGVKFW